MLNSQDFNNNSEYTNEDEYGEYENYNPADFEDSLNQSNNAANKVNKALNDLHNANTDIDEQKKLDVDLKVVAKLKTEKTIKDKEKYFYGFSSNLMKLDFSATEFKIIIAILENLKWGNVVCLTQRKVAEDIKTSASVVNRSWKKLIEKNVLIVDESTASTYLNTNLFFVGLYSQMDKQRRRDFERASVYDKDEENGIKHMHMSKGVMIEV